MPTEKSCSLMHSHTHFYHVHFPKGFSLCWGGWTTALAPQPSGWCSGQGKVAAAVTNRPQHLCPHPKEQCNSHLQELTKDGNQLNGETPKGRHSKGNCGMLPVPGSAIAASWAGSEGRCPCSITSQHTQEKVTGKAVGNKEKPELEHSNQ